MTWEEFSTYGYNKPEGLVEIERLGLDKKTTKKLFLKKLGLAEKFKEYRNIIHEQVFAKEVYPLLGLKWWGVIDSMEKDFIFDCLGLFIERYSHKDDYYKVENWN
ncbi:MAG: hypothetical protein AAGH46_12420 [Bacteroidota bacterium]